LTTSVHVATVTRHIPVSGKFLDHSPFIHEVGSSSWLYLLSWSWVYYANRRLSITITTSITAIAIATVVTAISNAVASR